VLLARRGSPLSGDMKLVIAFVDESRWYVLSQEEYLRDWTR
jgi:hypothetical protein